MDEEQEGQGLGAYENMDRSDIRPDFFDALNEEESGGASAGQAVKNSGADYAKNMLKDKEKRAAGEAVRKVASKVGGAEGKAVAKGIDLVEKKAGGLSSFTGKSKSKSKLKLAGKTALPLLAILLPLIILWVVASFVGQWLFPIGFKSRTMEDWNSTKTSNNIRTDSMTDQQLEGKSDSGKVTEETIFNNMGMTQEQQESLKQAGIGYEVSDDGKTIAMTFTSPDGKKNVVTSNKTISRYVGDGEVAEGGNAVADSGAEGVSEEEAKQQILVALGEDSDTRVMSFSQAMNDSQFKQLYTSATKYWRGDTSGWFTNTSDTVVKRLGISRNNYEDFTLSSDNSKNEEAFLELAKTKTTASEGGDLGGQSLKERVTKVAQDSKTTSCGATSAFNDIESVVATDQTARQVSAGSLWLEAIDKTMAGEGDKAPLTAVSNIVVNSGGATTAGMSHLFGSEVLEQSNEMVQKVSAQAHGNNESLTSNETEGINSGDYRGCVYTGDLEKFNGQGALVSVGSLFKRTRDWISKTWSSFKNLLASITNKISQNTNIGVVTNNTVNNATSGSNPSQIDSALSSTVDAYNEMKDQTYFNGNDTALLGEALVTSSERIMNEKAKSAGQVVGDETNLLANYRAQQEVIAEEAEYERATKSPFDISSQHTFFGSIVHSLIPFAVSSKSTVLTSTVSNVGSLLSNSLTKLLPTSDAISEAQVERGDCVLSNNIGAVSNPHCNNYYDSDLQLAGSKAEDLYNQAKSLRYDKTGYKIKSDVSSSDPEYGTGPLNKKEGNSCVTRWSGGKPVEWSYAIHPNFEYVGYKTGWPNRTGANTSAGVEGAKNDIEPEKCELDIALDENKQPKINKNGALGLFMIMSGQRGSEWGVADDANTKLIASSDFTKGRVHPCLVGSDECVTPYIGYFGVSEEKADEMCNANIYCKLGWTSKYDTSSQYKYDDSLIFTIGEWATDNDTKRKGRLEQNTATSKFMSRWIGGAAYVAYSGGSNGGSFGNMNTGFDNDDRFLDPTRLDDKGNPMYFWDEMRVYQSYAELLEWMETVGLVNKSGVAQVAEAYYDENPIDNTYEGKIARLSGLSKDRVVAVLDLFQYVAWLKDYDATALYPVPKAEPEQIKYDNGEIVAQAEKITTMAAIVYDEMRNRTVAA